MTEAVKPSAAALREALELSDDILRGVELSTSSLTNSALKTSRLARLLGDFALQKVFEYEAGGYPTTPGGVQPEVWACAKLAGRVKQRKNEKGEIKEIAVLESIEQLETQIESAKIGIDAARDPSVSVASANPHQYVHTGGNGIERLRLHGELKEAVTKLGSRRTFLHNYVAQRNLELRFSGVASDAFSRIRELVDASIGTVVPTAVQKFSAIYDNLQSENPEDWSNAVHGCRRVLQDLADALFPSSDTPREKAVGGKSIAIELGPDRYINRLMCFAEDHEKSERSAEIIGSQLAYLGNRLDALFQAAQKGSHAVIASRDEADRYVVYTYMLVGDLLRILQSTIAA